MKKEDLTLDKKYHVLLRASLEMVKLLRENPPDFSQTIIPFEDYINILAGGSIEDPNGYKFLEYFLNKALKEVERGEKC